MRSICGAALVIAATIAGCADGDGLPTGRFFENRTGMDITVVWERGSGERTPQATIPAGETRTIGMNQFGKPRNVCDDGDVVILGPSGDELIRRPASCDPWIIRLPAVPTSLITDRTWTLTGFAKPPQPMTKPAARATLRLDAKGAMTVETGCRTLVGHWATTADEVHPTDLNVAPGASGADCPAQLIDQDDQISGIAGTGFAVHVDDATLTATSNDGRYLDWQLVFTDETSAP